MRISILVALGFALLCQVSAAAVVDGGPEQPLENGDPNGICERVGKAFCGRAACVVSGTAKDSFTCDCGPDKYYYAWEEKCRHRESCTWRTCEVGNCKDEGGTMAGKCDCSTLFTESLTPDCKIQPYFQETCTWKKGRVVFKDRNAKCVCEEGQYLPLDNDFQTVCEDKPECEANQVWDDKTGKCESRKECTQPEKELCRADETCTFNGTHPVCGCTKRQRLSNNVCVGKYECTKDEIKACRADQSCIFNGTHPVCRCGEHQRLLDGVCTGKCSTNQCHEILAACRIRFGKEQCFCKEPLTAIGTLKGGECIFGLRPYIVTFQTNDTAYSKLDTCLTKQYDLLKTMRTIYGRNVKNMDLLECGNEVRIRLNMWRKQDPATLKILQQCQFPEGDMCVFPPALYVRKDSVKDIYEEDLCKGAFKELLDAPGGPQVCVKEGDMYVLKCKDGFIAHNATRSGRVTLWSCKEKNGGAAIKASTFAALALVALPISFTI